MAANSKGKPDDGQNTARRGRGRGQSATRARTPPPRGTAAPRDPAQEAPAAPSAPPGDHAPGLDAALHAVAQRTAQQAELLRLAYVPACLATALGMDARFDGSACRLYLDQFIAAAGDPQDPVERTLIEQVAVARLRLADLHAQAAQAKSVEAAKVYAGATARLLGEVRRVALTLREYRGRTPESTKPRLAKVG